MNRNIFLGHITGYDISPFKSNGSVVDNFNILSVFFVFTIAIVSCSGNGYSNRYTCAPIGYLKLGFSTGKLSDEEKNG